MYSCCSYCLYATYCPCINQYNQCLSEVSRFYNNDLLQERPEGIIDDMERAEDFEELEITEEQNEELLRASQQDVNRILSKFLEENRDILQTFRRYNIEQRLARHYLSVVIGYVLDNESNINVQNINAKVNRLLNRFQRTNHQLVATLLGVGMPVNIINNITRETIRFTLKNLGETPSKPGWSQWEDLGGVITSSPGASSWGPNRIDVFARRQNNAMWHIYWNGTRWSTWEDLGGILTSGPAASSWGPNRIDCFVRGTDNAMYHKWWDGQRWNDWESLGGILTSAPAASSWGPNRIDCFVRGTDNAMYHKWWDGRRWNDWESLGGSLTSAPAASSWGPNRIDCFVKGTDNAMYHKWWDGQRWSDWENLGGYLTSAPAVCSTEVNIIHCFAKGRNNELIYKFWNGRVWSEWESLGGNLTSDPTATSWGRNRIDVFAKGVNNHLWHIYR